MAVEEDLARDGTLSLVSLVRAANTLLARVQCRSRFVAVLAGEREVYAAMDVSQAFQLSKLGLLTDSLEDVMSISAW